jgi:hypothetical protein
MPVFPNLWVVAVSHEIINLQEARPALDTFKAVLSPRPLQPMSNENSKASARPSRWEKTLKAFQR